MFCTISPSCVTVIIMSRPLNDDGTVPLRRRLQLVIRITGDEPTEVSRDMRPLWTLENCYNMPVPEYARDVDVMAEMTKIMAEEMQKRMTPELLQSMLRELMWKSCGS